MNEAKPGGQPKWGYVSSTPGDRLTLRVTRDPGLNSAGLGSARAWGRVLSKWARVFDVFPGECDADEVGASALCGSLALCGRRCMAGAVLPKSSASLRPEM